MSGRDSLTNILLKGLDILFFLYIFFVILEYTSHGHLPKAAALSQTPFAPHLIPLMLLLSFLWNRTLSRAGIYSFTGDQTIPEAVKHVLMGTSFGTALSVFSAILLGWPGIDSQFTRWFWAASLAFFVPYHVILFELRRYLLKRKFLKTIIVGFNERALSIHNSLKHSRGEMSIFDLSEEAEPTRQLHGGPERVEFGSLKDFSHRISTLPMDEVIVALPVRSHYDQIHKIIALCSQQGIRVRLATNLFDLPSKITRLHMPHSKESLVLHETYLHPAMQHDLKRVVDIVGSAVGLVVFSPLFLVVSLAILCVDGPPIFFVQKRIGLNKRRFKMFKFRTMTKNSENLQDTLEAQNEYGEGAAAFKLESDPRITKLGRILRRTSIDELPQLLNVLLGSMSLVGPRPLPLRDFDRFYNDSHRLRFSVKPGITGLWQVSGRSDVQFEEWMGLDLNYAENWNFLLDIKILLKTVLVVISGKGAR
jgi:exopolysaccharide biosynthesis polyprenyl glycosylphosphotransferase